MLLTSYTIYDIFYIDLILKSIKYIESIDMNFLQSRLLNKKYLLVGTATPSTAEPVGIASELSDTIRTSSTSGSSSFTCS